MKWLIVAIFANIEGDVYIFTDPTFDTKIECEQSIRNPEMIPFYVQKIISEYNGTPPKLKTIGCLDEKTIGDILNQRDKA